MTVAELIKQLRKLDQEAEVMLIVRDNAAAWLRRVEPNTGAKTVDLHAHRTTTRRI